MSYIRPLIRGKDLCTAVGKVGNININLPVVFSYPRSE
jgi:hypothetical protein